MVKKRKIQTKGVRYISSKLNKYFKNKFPTKTSALPKAREVLNTLKANGDRVTIKNISSLIRKKREKGRSKDDAPKIYSELASPIEYYLLNNYPDWIQWTTNEVWFDSKISPSGLPMIQGGSLISYNDYFKAFVDYCNGMVALSDGEIDSLSLEYLVVCTKPNKKNARKRWESQILAIGSDGIPYNFGFDPDSPDKEPTKAETTPSGREGSQWDEKEPEPKEKPKKTPKTKPKKEPKPKKTPKTPKEAPKKEPKRSDTEAKVELKKLQIIEKIYDMFLQGKITKAEMNKMIAKYE